MLLLDVNILVYAHREEVARHSEYRAWVERLVDSDQAFGVPELVLSGFLRIVTHPKIFDEPTPQEIALQLVEEIRRHPSHLEVRPGARHWNIFVDLCRQTGARGNLVPDAYLAALAIESGCTWVTSDRDLPSISGLGVPAPLGVKGGPSLPSTCQPDAGREAAGGRPGRSYAIEPEGGLSDAEKGSGFFLCFFVLCVVLELRTEGGRRAWLDAEWNDLVSGADRCLS